MAGAPVLPIDIAQFLAHPELQSLDAPTLGWLLKAVMLSWQQEEPCSLPNDEQWVRTQLGCGNQYQWEKAWRTICRWWKPLGKQRVCKPLRRVYESSRRSLVNSESLITFPTSYDESYFSVKETSPKVVNRVVKEQAEEKDGNVIPISSRLTAEVKGREGSGEEPSRNPSFTAEHGSISLQEQAVLWMWEIIREERMVGPRAVLQDLRRSKLRALWDEHLLPLYRDEGRDPVLLFREICRVVKSRPWWSENPSRWEPNYCFSSPVNRERHVTYALGIGPEYEHDRATANKPARADGTVGGAARRSRGRYDQYASRDEQST
jgi:hypothetical protein